MLKIADFATGPLKWAQPKMSKHEYELLAEQQLLATLKFRSMFGTLATGESGDGCWTFKRVGFWQNKATIRECGSETDLATFKNNTWSSGGTLEFVAGPTFRATTNFWMSKYEFRTGGDEPLLRFKYGGTFRLSSTVEVLPAASALRELPLLVLFGWYLAINLHNDAAAGAAVVAVTA